MLAAGPAAVWMLALAGGLLAAAVHPLPGVLYWLAALAAADGALNLVPFRAGSVRTDGWRIVHWFRHPANALVRQAINALNHEASRGRRPRDWSRSWLETVSAPADEAAVLASGQYLAYLAAWDAGRAGDAERHLRAALSVVPGLPPALAGTVLAEAAFHVAYVGRDAAGARQLLARVPRLRELGPARVRAQAAIALAAGNAARAAEACDRLLAAPDSPVRPGVSLALKDWTAAIRAEAAANEGP